MQVNNVKGGKGIIYIAEVTTSSKKLKSSRKKTIGHFWEQHQRNRNDCRKLKTQKGKGASHCKLLFVIKGTYL